MSAAPLSTLFSLTLIALVLSCHVVEIDRRYQCEQEDEE